MPTAADIQIRDPFVLPVPSEKRYYLFGTTDKNAWTGPGTGFDCYTSRDLLTFDGPHPAFRPPPNFWATTNFWAPEVHRYRNRFFMFATFKSDDRRRGTQIFAADHPRGPFIPHSPGPVTPPDWESLDGTLYVDSDDQPWLVFCHEWLQIHDGTICAQRLAPDLSHALGQPTLLFAASHARWPNLPANPERFVTDGPFLHRLPSGTLLMLWSTFAHDGYAIGVATSPSGHIAGPWHHDHPRFFTGVGGHGMLFTTFNGQLMLTLHAPNETPNERPLFIPVRATEHGLELATTG